MLKWVAVTSLTVAVAVSTIPILSAGEFRALATVSVRPARVESTNRIIVKLRDPQPERTADSDAKQALGVSFRAGVALQHLRAMSGDAQVFVLPASFPISDVEGIAQRLAADPNIEYAEPDRRVHPLLIPNDTQFANQWNFQTLPGEVASANLPAAWAITTGSSSIVVAVIDTGIVAHADIDTNVTDGTGRIASGYDFISSDGGGRFVTANDGNGRDADPTDPGDWITAAESAGTAGSGVLEDCDVSDSSWHGTHTAGTIAATGNNALGVAGINWVSRILPVRALGKCGGFTSDVVDAIRWSAGLSVSGVPANTTPAKVINLSLGSIGSCGSSQQSAINAAIAAGTVVVVAAGNDSVNAATSSPANCTGVISVAAVARDGSHAFYSNYGPIVKIAAPGGQWGTLFDPNSILSTLNSGTTSPAASPGGDMYQYYQGTSMAAPHVAGVASLMLSLRPNMKPLRTLAFLQQTARSFVTGTGDDCTTSICGAGMLDAAAAVAAVNATVAPAVSAGTDHDGSIGRTVTLSGSATPTFPAAVSGYVWSQTGGSHVTLKNASTATAKFTMPSATTVGSIFTFSLTATDDVGMSSSSSVQITAVSPPPGSGGGGGGGGGGCFIATAAYGSPMERDVRYLRAFRDQYLMTNAPGRRFVGWYYHTSPPWADRLRAHDNARAVVRGLLAPLVGLSKWIVDEHTLAQETEEKP